MRAYASRLDRHSVDHEKEQRLLIEPLCHSWPAPAPRGSNKSNVLFWAAANVGVFFRPTDFLVPDGFLVRGISGPKDMSTAYFIWEHKRPPEVVIEIVSNRRGHELTSKRVKYAQWGIKFYIVFDPESRLGEDKIYVFELIKGKYVRRTTNDLPGLNLSVKLWTGTYENCHGTYMRWCDGQGRLLLTGAERVALRESELVFANERTKTAVAERDQVSQLLDQTAAERDSLRAELEAVKANIKAQRPR